MLQVREPYPSVFLERGVPNLQKAIFVQESKDDRVGEPHESRHQTNQIIAAGLVQFAG